MSRVLRLRQPSTELIDLTTMPPATTPPESALQSVRVHGNETHTSHVEDLRVLYDLYGEEIFRFCARVLRDRGLAEEAMQETFLRAWRSPARQAGEVERPRPWLFAVARSTCFDAQRRLKVRPVTAGSELPEVEVDDGIDEVFANWTVEEALRRISDDHRYAVVEVYLKGRRYQELANELGVPDATVRSRVFYGLKALRLALEEMGLYD